MSDLRARLVEAALSAGMTAEEAELAADDGVRRHAWRLRRGARRCSSCGEDKPVRAFGLDSTRRDGRRAVCRSCR